MSTAQGPFAIHHPPTPIRLCLEKLSLETCREVRKPVGQVGCGFGRSHLPGKASGDGAF